MILRLLRRAAAGSLGTYTYPVYVGVTVPIGTTIGGVALLLQIVLRKKWQSVIVYKVYTCAAREPPREAAKQMRKNVIVYKVYTSIWIPPPGG